MSRNLPYDSGESRRSPRDRSPLRRNDSRDGGRYNTGYPRDGDLSQRSNSISRNAPNTFGRDDFREPRGDLFPNHRDIPRDIPRGPKAQFEPRESPRDVSSQREPPSGPRANNYSSDYRGRGRGRGRGGYYDSDRVQPERDNYRDRRDDRPFRDERADRGRFTDPRERREISYRGGRRPSPPSAPSYRGRGRGVDDFRRFNRGRSRSPEPYDRTMRRSSMVSPPPAVVDVPAFGAVAVSERKAPDTTSERKAVDTPQSSGTATNVPIPTGPRNQPKFVPPVAQWRSGGPSAVVTIPTGPASNNADSSSRMQKSSSPVNTNRPVPMPTFLFPQHSDSPTSHSNGEISLVSTPLQHALQEPLDVDDDDSESESEDEDELGTGYFDDELAKAQQEHSGLQEAFQPFRSLPLETIEEIEKLLQAEREIVNQTESKESSKGVDVSQATITESLNLAAPNQETAHKSAPNEYQAALARATAPVTASSAVENGLSRDSRSKESGVGADTATEAVTKAPTSPTTDVVAPTNVEDRSDPKPGLRLIYFPSPIEEDVDDMSDIEYEEEMTAIRGHIPTPPLESLPYLTSPSAKLSIVDSLMSNGIQTEGKDFLRKPDLWNTTMAQAGAPDVTLMQSIAALMIQREQSERAAELAEKECLAVEWKRKYKDWLGFHRSNDPDAVANRERWARNREVHLTPPTGGTPLPEARPEGRRAGRFATEADMERVLRESERDHLKFQNRDKREEKELALYKEAVIPDMYTARQTQVHMFRDTTGLVDPDRAIDVFQVCPINLDFTEEEHERFMDAILAHPKRWVQMAEDVGRTYKDCIQYYYQIKHEYGIRARIAPKRKGRRPGPSKKKLSSKPKANALTSTMMRYDEDGDNADGGDNVTKDGDGATKAKSPRPKRAAAPVTFDKNSNRSDMDTATPAATPGRKPRARAEAGADPVKQKRTKKEPKAETTKKQTKNGQSLTPASASRSSSKNRTIADDKQPKSYTPIPPPQPLGSSSSSSNWVPPIPAYTQPKAESFYTPPVAVSIAQPETLVLHHQERTEPATTLFEAALPQRAAAASTSSYWSVPEQNDFPSLLDHFGTDWTAISKHMQSKTLTMVYTTVFQPWLTMPKDSNKSRRVANLEKQVKNYYQRNVEGGKTDWEQRATIADQKRARGEPTGPPPIPTIPLGTKRVQQRTAGTVMEGSEERGSPHMAVQGSPLVAGLQRAPSPSFSHASRYPTLAQAGPSGSNAKNSGEALTPKTNPQSQQAVQSQPRPQQAQSQKPPRGPAMGFFNPTDGRPVLKPSHTPQPQPQQMPPKDLNRASIVAREAEREQAQALARIEHQRLEQQRAEQDRAESQRFAQQQQINQQRIEQQRLEHQQRLEQQQHADQRAAEARHDEQQRQDALLLIDQRERERSEQQRIAQLKQHKTKFLRSLKQEPDSQGMGQYEQYSTQPQAPNVTAAARHDSMRSGESLRHQMPGRHDTSTYRPEQGQVAFARYDDRSERGPEPSRSAPPMQPYGAHEIQGLHSNEPGQMQNLNKSGPLARNAMSATPVRHDSGRPSPAIPPPSLATVRQQDTARKSNIMSLLNDDEPSESRQAPSKPATPMMPTSHSPAVRESMYQPPPRQLSGSGPSQYAPSSHHQQPSQSSPYIPPQQTRQPLQHGQQQHQSASLSHSYGQQQQPPHQIHQSQQSTSQRSYTPHSYEPPYPAPAPLPVRRETALGDMHGHHSRVSSGPQPGMRALNESPYSAPANPVSRQQATSPMERTYVDAGYPRGGPGPAYISQPQQTGYHQDPRGYGSGAPISQQQQQQQMEAQRRQGSQSGQQPMYVNYDERRLQEEQERRMLYERDRAAQHHHMEYEREMERRAGGRR